MLPNDVCFITYLNIDGGGSSSSVQTCNNSNIEQHNGDDDDLHLDDLLHLDPTNAEDINRFRNMGHEVDDNNDPVPENIPEELSNTTEEDEDPIAQTGQTWGDDYIDPRLASNAQDTSPKIKHGMDPMAWENISYLDMFLSEAQRSNY